MALTVHKYTDITLLTIRMKAVSSTECVHQVPFKGLNSVIPFYLLDLREWYC